MMEEKDRFEEFLHGLMQEGGHEQAPANFTQRVMGEITAPQTAPAKTRWKPVITWRGWVGIAASTLAVILISMGLPWTYSEEPLPGQVAAGKALDTTVNALESIQFPTTLALCLAALFLLFTLDRLLSRRIR